ncbi:hypothetical protein MIMGU_mgv1a019063mg, partial [Erythranthe guttata]
NLSFLREINLQNNSFSGRIPQEIGLLRRLEYIEFSNNSFTGRIMPKNITQWKNLVYLNLIDNNLSGPIPSEIQFSEKLRYLGLAKNKISGVIPRFIGNLTSLRTLYLRFCDLEGEIPESISQLTRLSNLNLGDNNLTGTIPSSLFNISTIERFVVDFNGLHGSIPSTIGLTLPNLRKIPSGIGNLVGLTYLYLVNHYLEGPLPSEIGKLFNLNILNLAQNRFTGDIPSIFGNLSSITKLNLYENNFSGAIPKSLGNCTNMLELNLLRNNLTGPIPQEILISTISISLDLSHNALTGSIPSQVGSLSSLVMLDFSNNRLSGLIPNSLGTCISLERLYLEGNLFEGQIPQGLSPLTGLTYLDLSRNNLSGTIPSFLGLLRLEQLNLSFNMLQGQVPTTGVLRNKTITSLQGNEELCGGILELDLPRCTTSSSKKNLSTPLKIAIPIVGVAALLCIIIFLYKRGTHKKVLPSLPSFMGTQFLRLSYSDLLKATGGFAETSLVGAGSFGYVYKGVLDDGVTVIAVKVLNLVVKGASKSFLAECNSLRGIRHRNLVKILSVCESIDFQGNDFKALVYEFKANGSLDKWLYYNGEQEEGSDAQLRNLDLIERLDIAIDVAHALEYLHSGIGSVIVHGDLKPSNILLDEDMTACVGDFGLSKIVSRGDVQFALHINQIICRLPLISSNVCAEYGMSNAISTEGDVYSYGILILEMFTNKKPTDDSFMDHANLHNFVNAALPDHVMEILDPLVRIGPRENNNKFEDCMSCILNIGVLCSKEMPRDRISMSDVVSELRKIQKELSC